MKRVAYFALVLGVIFYASAASAQKIVLKAINTKTGVQINGSDGEGAVLYWLFDADKKNIPVFFNRDTRDHPGLEVQDMQNADSIKVEPNGYMECRKASDRGQYYSISEIVAHGIIAPNSCNKLTVVATPGVLVLFMRPQNWFERHFHE